MLVLTRKIQESIVIGDQIRVVVLEAGRNRVKLGIAAPEDVIVRRSELGAWTPPQEPPGLTAALAAPAALQLVGAE